MIYLSEKHDLQRFIIMIEDAKGVYVVMAHKTEDPEAKQMYQELEKDMNKHLKSLQDRLYYLNRNQG